VKLLAGPKNYESSLCAERKRARRKPLFLFLAGDKYQFCKQMKWNPGALLKTLLTRDSACKLELLPRAAPFESHFFAAACVCVCIFLLFLGHGSAPFIFISTPETRSTILGVRFCSRTGVVRRSSAALEADLVRRRLLTLTRGLLLTRHHLALAALARRRAQAPKSLSGAHRVRYF